MLKARATKEEREEESDRRFIHIHHAAFEWLRVAANEVGTRINQTQPLGLGTHSSHVGIFRF